MSKAELMVIDDEEEMLRLLEITLESNDFKVVKALRAKEGLIMAANHPPDLIILDLGLPDESGHVVLQKLREWYTKPILILSVQDNEVDIVKALDNGADDYLVKPFRTGELLARIRSALRGKSREQKEQQLRYNGLFLDLELRVVKRNSELVKLTATEYNLLSLLITNEGKVLTHRFLLQQVWGPGFQDQTQYLRVFIAQLRKKIEDDPNNPDYILTESGVGYRFIGKEN
jgi:two-component system, OmpR family, KDP operon response regulator KdpE